MKTRTIGAAPAALLLLLLPGCLFAGGPSGVTALMGGLAGGAAGPMIPGLFGDAEMTPEQLEAEMDKIEATLRQQKLEVINDLAEDMETGKLFADGVADLLGEQPAGADLGIGLEAASPPPADDPFKALRTHLGDISPDRTPGGPANPVPAEPPSENAVSMM